MGRKISLRFDPYALPSPCFIVDEALLSRNISIIDRIQKESKAKFLLALKGFSMFSTFPKLNKVLYGVTASTLDEARLGFEEFKKEVHTFQTAYSEKDLIEVLKFSDHIIFNSFSQWHRFQNLVKDYFGKVDFGIRVNPECSAAPVEIYDPCARFSRLGVTIDKFKDQDLANISGLHFHALCEEDSFALEKVLNAFESKFGKFLANMKWVNFGGGHHVTREDYNVEHLISLINNFRKRHNDIVVYLEPGEAIALNAGFFVTTVLDIIENEKSIAVLDSSAAAHLPDVIEMPYRPNIVGAGNPGEFAYDYRLAGLSCLAGDVIGDYSFNEPLKVGDRLVFLDMAHYTMVKTNTFNGIRLPSIVLLEESGLIKVVREFDYFDFKNRLS